MAEQNEDPRFIKLALGLAKMNQMFESLHTKMHTMEQNQTKNLEKLVKQATDKDSYQDAPGIEPSLLDSLPDKLSTNDLPKFKVTNNPRFHLKAFKLYMEIKRVDPRLYPRFFPMSLEDASQKWYFSLSPKEIATWEDITHTFMKRYKGNTHATTY